MSSIENISPAVIRRISHDLYALQSNPPEGIRVIVKDDDICDIQAWIMGPEGTPYQNGYFKVKLILGTDFPSVPPKCYIVTKIFHPNVSKAGEVCVNTLKKDWNKDLGINHILLTVKCLLIIPNAESALNEEAGRLLLENYDDYAKHARLMTKIHASAKPFDVSFTEPSSQNGSSPSSCSTAPQSTSSQSKKSPSKDGLIKSEDKKDEAIDTKGERKTDVKDGKSDQSEHEPMTNVHSAATSPLGVSNSINEGISLKKNTGESTITVTPRKRAAEEKKLEKKQVDKKRSLKRL